MKAGDVFRFHYNEAERRNRFEPHHCFDGQLVFCDGMLVDTYWGFNPTGDGGRRFTPAEAERQGTLEFVCNINEVEEVPEHAFLQYANADAFDLSHQHGCHRLFVARKGAKKDVSRQLKIIDERMQKAKRHAELAMWAAFREIERGLQLSVDLAAGKDVSI